MHRVVQNVFTNPDQLMVSLQEYANLFDIYAEEDPGYRQIQILQDAGILPVDIHNENANPFGGIGAGGPMMGARPRGVSDNVPQEAIDELMREDPTQNDHSNNFAQPNGAYPQNHDQTAIFGQNIQSTATDQVIPHPNSQVDEMKQDEQTKPGLPKKQEPPRRVITLPEEPGEDNSDATKIVFRMPISGERVQRRFLKSDKVQLIYDFIDHLQNEEKCKFDGVESYTDQYEILQTRPRVVYNQKDQTMEEASLWPRGAILQIQQLEDKDDESD